MAASTDLGGKNHQEEARTPKVKRTTLLSLRLALTCVAMGVAYFLSTMAIGETNVPMTAEEASQAGMALVLSFLILGSPWHGPKLVGLVILIQLGAETLMTQIETLHFKSALRMGRAEFAAIVAAGALRAPRYCHS